MAAIAQEIESLPEPEREREIRRLIAEKKEQIAALEELLPVPSKTIVVNGREHTLEKQEVSYEEIVEIAHGPKARGRLLTVVCDGGTEGYSLVPGMSVKIESGMVFSAQDTSSA